MDAKFIIGKIKNNNNGEINYCGCKIEDFIIQ